MNKEKAVYLCSVCGEPYPLEELSGDDRIPCGKLICKKCKESDLKLVL
jgi:DNA-directed RNA polymerase subunit RPC12/RpoP